MRREHAILCCLGSVGLSLLLVQQPARAQAVTFEATELLGRPTDRSVTVNAMADQAVEAFFVVDTVSRSDCELDASLGPPPATFEDGRIERVLDGLEPDQAYYYHMCHRPSGSSEDWTAEAEHSFHTQRASDQSFVFTIAADSHQGFASFYNANLYEVMYANVIADHPDFHLDLGDTFSLDNAVETEASVRQKYLDQRVFFDRVAHSTPIFLALGNHENEEGWNLDDTTDVADSLPVLGANARKRYFLNPIPSDFYTGNADDSLAVIDGDHLREDYYAFTWGAALFVVLDPFWYTTVKPFAGTTGGEKLEPVTGNRWDWTLGAEQYQWLERTLETSTATFKFVFSHHASGGGVADYMRGGAEGARYCEWGGYDTDAATWGFDSQRPGWDAPIHSLMVDNGVTAFFHGHDHIFAYETLDGIVYQECPFAANTGYGAAYGPYGIGFPTNLTDYSEAVRVNNSGHLRVTVAPNQVRVDYVRAYLPGDGSNGTVAHSYTIDPGAHNSRPNAIDDLRTTPEDTRLAISVLTNDTDSDGNALSVISATDASHGSVVRSGGVLTYQPDADYCDETTPDHFQYVISDGHGSIDRAEVEVTVTCVNDAPLAANDSASTRPATVVRIPVVANDGDVDSDLDPSSVALAEPPTHGVAVENEDGSMDYAPEPGYTGTDSFVYTICDDEGLCDEATVSVSVTCTAASECDDGDPCTNESCTQGICGHFPMNCSDGYSCTVDDCVDGACVHEPNDGACGPSDACSTVLCDPAHASSADGCVSSSVDCDDGDYCTLDGCSPSSGCGHTPRSCDDGNPCTEDRCSTTNAACTHTTKTCPANTLCATWACSPMSGECVSTPVDCDDSVACTVDRCDGTEGCLHTPNESACDDGEPCTLDTCDAAEGCIRTHSDQSCDDGDPCTTDDRCVAGTCVGTPADCSSVADECHVGACDPNHLPACVAVPVPDGVPCSLGACRAGQCVAGAADASGAAGTAGQGGGGAGAGDLLSPGGFGLGGSPDGRDGSLARGGVPSGGGATAATDPAAALEPGAGGAEDAGSHAGAGTGGPTAGPGATGGSPASAGGDASDSGGKASSSSAGASGLVAATAGKSGSSAATATGGKLADAGEAGNRAGGDAGRTSAGGVCACSTRQDGSSLPWSRVLWVAMGVGCLARRRRGCSVRQRAASAPCSGAVTETSHALPPLTRRISAPWSPATDVGQATGRPR